MNKDDPYQPDNVPLVEALYGKHLISLGGTQAVDSLFSGVDVSGQKILDVGFGIGGTDFYLAQKYQASIYGIEINPWMVAHASKNAPAEIKHLLQFTTYKENGEMPFNNDFFDIVYSKGVFNHIKDKLPLLEEIHRVLKPNGLLLVADWIHEESKVDSTAFLAQETQSSYQAVLEQAAFKDIRFKDESIAFLGYVKTLIENLTAKKDFIEENFGKEIYSEVWEQHQKLMKEINDKSKFAVRILAIK